MTEAMLLVARKIVAERHGWMLLAAIDAYASFGCEQHAHGLGTRARRSRTVDQSFSQPGPLTMSST